MSHIYLQEPVQLPEVERHQGHLSESSVTSQAFHGSQSQGGRSSNQNLSHIILLGPTELPETVKHRNCLAWVSIIGPLQVPEPARKEWDHGICLTLLLQEPAQLPDDKVLGHLTDPSITGQALCGSQNQGERSRVVGPLPNTHAKTSTVSRDSKASGLFSWLFHYQPGPVWVPKPGRKDQGCRISPTFAWKDLHSS